MGQSLRTAAQGRGLPDRDSQRRRPKSWRVCRSVMVHDPGVSARWRGKEARGALMDREVGGGLHWVEWYREQGSEED